MDLTVHYQDDVIIIVDKPYGVASQRDRAGVDGVFEILKAEFEYVGLHHRLDQPASGLLLFTLSKSANRKVSKAMKRHEIARGYQAVLVGQPRVQIWDKAIDDKPARTDVSVIGHKDGMSLVNIHLHTGRPYQIRRHAAFNGTPIAGDKRFGAEAGQWWRRLALHATSMALRHPVTGNFVSVTSPIPDTLAPLWDMIAKK